MNTKEMLRTVDELGRIILPVEFCNALKIQKKSQVSVTLENEALCIRPIRHTCVLCGCNMEDAVELKGQCLCSGCIDTIKAL
ncbi:MAG: AbrB/MazE/SpoVT family DNA-binding domain-containing protein [Clostridia bacterium]|nr:AbrB/MazE/SpoVT family DNA-binding domain-containing protein [Clostridia bacterium]